LKRNNSFVVVARNATTTKSLFFSQKAFSNFELQKFYKLVN